MAQSSLRNFLQFVGQLSNFAQAVPQPSPTIPAGSSQYLSQIQALASGQMPLTGIDPSLTSALLGAAPQPEIPVWLGGITGKTHPSDRGKNARSPKPVVPNAPTPVTADLALYEPLKWSDKERDAAYKRVSSSLGTEITSFSQFQSAWKMAVGLAQQSWAATNGGKSGKLLSVWDVFDLMKRDNSLYGTGGSRTITQTSRTVNQLSDGSAYMIIKNAARQALGRNPTSSEVKQFAARAHRIAVSNPTISRSTVTTDAMGNTSTSTKVKQGANADDFQMAAEKKVDTEEAGAYQAATTYYNAMLSALDSIV